MGERRRTAFDLIHREDPPGDMPRKVRAFLRGRRPRGRNPTMTCPECGVRGRAADTMVDVEAEELGDHFAAPLVCSTCVHHLERMGEI